jgi:hypothetical protein
VRGEQASSSTKAAAGGPLAASSGGRLADPRRSCERHHVNGDGLTSTEAAKARRGRPERSRSDTRRLQRSVVEGERVDDDIGRHLRPGHHLGATPGGDVFAAWIRPG